MHPSLTVYGATTCDDTERTVGWLNAWGVAFREVNIDHDPEADAFVRVINAGYRSTPTLVLGDGKLKLILTEPTENQLREVLARADAATSLGPEEAAA